MLFLDWERLVTLQRLRWWDFFKCQRATGATPKRLSRGARTIFNVKSCRASGCCPSLNNQYAVTILLRTLRKRQVTRKLTSETVYSRAQDLSTIGHLLVRTVPLCRLFELMFEQLPPLALSIEKVLPHHPRRFLQYLDVPKLRHRQIPLRTRPL